MKSFQCVSDETVLLVGEGNFSFTKDFLSYNNTLGFYPQIISSCYEYDNTKFSDLKLENISYIEKRNIKVLLGVDATCINDHPVLKKLKFSKIIFNFPHVGGKMKINLNRNLLKHFFQSAGNILDFNGSIIVALCDGQGGTEADNKIRRWDDTWQILEMAAHSNLVLKDVEPFDSSCFPNYSSVGYRSRDVSFHTEGAVVHTFEKSNYKEIPSEEEMLKIFELDEVNSILGTKHCSKVYTSKISSNPLINTKSPQYYLYKILKTSLDAPDLEYIEDIFVTTHEGECQDSLSCILDQRRSGLSDMRKVIFEKCQAYKAGYELFVAKNIFCNSLKKDFSTQPVFCQIFIFGNGCIDRVKSFIVNLLSIFRTETNFNDVNMGILPEEIKNCFDFSTVVSEYVTVESCVVNLDNLAMGLFHIHNWQCLWADGGFVNENEAGLPIFYPFSLYPRKYTFDICFSDNEDYTEEKFFSVLWHVAGDIIVSVELLNVYIPPDRNFTCFCYRINYRSYTNPMHRKRVIEIHQNVIGKMLNSVLKLNIS